MARYRVPRRFALACAAAFLACAGAQAQMAAGGYSGLAAVQAAQQAQTSGTAVVAQPTSSYSNPYSNTGVAASTARPTINGQTDPYAPASAQGAATGQYATPLGQQSLMPTNLQTSSSGAGQAYGGSPGYYGGAGEPAAPPSYSVQNGPGGAGGGGYAAAPQYAPQYYTPPPAYAPQPQQAAPQPAAPQQAAAQQPLYQPLAYPQYGASGQPYAPPQQYAQPAPQYAQPAPQYAPPPQYAPAPQYAPPQQAAAPGTMSTAMAPGNNLIASPYAAMRGSAAPAPGAPQTEGGYTLGPGDKVNVTVYGEADLSREYQLDGNGNIRLQLGGVVHAAGYTPQMLEAVIYNALVPNFLRNPRINVEVVTYRPVYVLGQVQKPGQYIYANNMTMQNVIGLAGGFTPQAKTSVVYVRHEGETREEEIPAAQPLLIRPGDSIRIDTTLFWDAMNLFAPLSGPAAMAATVARP